MSLDWSGDWRAKFFGLPARRLPVGYRSDAMASWQAANEQREERWREGVREWAARRRRQAEQDAFEQLKRDVEQFGADVVVTLCRKYGDPDFQLPPGLADQPRKER